MRCIAIDTIDVGAYPNLTLVEVRTDDGLVVLGETFRGTQAVAAHVHESTAPWRIGAGPRRAAAALVRELAKTSIEHAF